MHTRLSHYSSHSITLNKERKSYISMSLSLNMLFYTLRNFVVLTYVVGNSPKIKKIALFFAHSKASISTISFIIPWTIENRPTHTDGDSDMTITSTHFKIQLSIPLPIPDRVMYNCSRLLLLYLLTKVTVWL